MIKEYIKKVFHKLVLAERSPTKLALSFCLGNFIAWSPTIPFQTPLIFLLSWLLRLNTTVTFSAVYLINNPFTMVPIYALDYAFGVFLFHRVLNMDLTRHNPLWVERFNAFLSKYIDMEKYLGGSEFCFWCLILGGLILALLISIALYPIMKRIFVRLIAQVTKREKERLKEEH